MQIEGSVFFIFALSLPSSFLFLSFLRPSGSIRSPSQGDRATDPVRPHAHTTSTFPPSPSYAHSPVLLPIDSSLPRFLSCAAPVHSLEPGEASLHTFLHVSYPCLFFPLSPLPLSTQILAVRLVPSPSHANFVFSLSFLIDLDTSSSNKYFHSTTEAQAHAVDAPLPAHSHEQNATLAAASAPKLRIFQFFAQTRSSMLQR